MISISKMAALLALAIASAQAAEIDKSTLIRRYMEAYGLPHVAIRYVSVYLAEAKRIYPEVKESVWTSPEMTRALKQYEQELLRGWKSVYYEHLTTAELEELLGFLETETGKKFLKLDLDLRPSFEEATVLAGGSMNDRIIEVLREGRAP